MLSDLHRRTIAAVFIHKLSGVAAFCYNSDNVHGSIPPQAENSDENGNLVQSL